MQGWQTRDFVVRRTHAQLGVDLIGDAAGEVWRGDLVDWDDDGSAQQASKKSCDPLCAVFAPDEYLVAFADAAGFEFAREAVGRAEDVAVAPSLGAISAAMDVRGLASVAAKVVQVVKNGGASHPETV